MASLGSMKGQRPLPRAGWDTGVTSTEPERGHGVIPVRGSSQESPSSHVRRYSEEARMSVSSARSLYSNTSHNEGAPPRFFFLSHVTEGRRALLAAAAMGMMLSTCLASEGPAPDLTEPDSTTSRWRHQHAFHSPSWIGKYGFLSRASDLHHGTLGPSSQKPFAESSGVPLNLEEDDTCLMNEHDAPGNTGVTLTTVKLDAAKSAQHNNDETTVNEACDVYKMDAFPWVGRECMMTFNLPATLAKNGVASLTLTKVLNEIARGWACHSYELSITRLLDDKYLRGRNRESETDEKVVSQVGADLGPYTFDISPLVYRSGAAGNPLHLLLRHTHNGCLTAFSTPNGGRVGPTLTVEVQSGEEDARYAAWDNFSPCRLSCVTPVNYQCRKRKCTPGSEHGERCKVESMVDKQPCAAENLKGNCTCGDLNAAKACPPPSVCDDSVPNAVKCRCSGSFTRTSVLEKTSCQGHAEIASEEDAPKQIPMKEAPTVQPTNNAMLAVYIVLGVVGVIIVIGFLILLGKRKKHMTDEELLGARIDPNTGAVTAAGGGSASSYRPFGSPGVCAPAAPPPYGMMGGPANPPARPGGYVPVK